MFDAQDLTTLGEDELRSIRGRDIAMIFQDPMTSLNPVTVPSRWSRRSWPTGRSAGQGALDL